MAEDQTLRRSLKTSREDEARPLKDFLKKPQAKGRRAPDSTSRRASSFKPFAA